LKGVIKDLLWDYTHEYINERELREKIIKYIHKQEEIIPLLEMILEIAKKQGVELKNIKKELADRYVWRASNLVILEEDIFRAKELYNELKNEDGARICDKLYSLWCTITEENEEELKKLKNKVIDY